MSSSTVWGQCWLSTFRRDSKTGALARSSRRREIPFLPDRSHGEHYRSCLPSLPWKPSWQGVTRSDRAAKWVRTLSCSRSPNLAPNSIGSEIRPASSWVAPRVDPKQCSPPTPDIVLSWTVKSHWTQKGYEEPCSIRQRADLHPSAYDGSQLWGWTLGEERLSSPSVPIRHLLSMTLHIRHSQAPIAKTLMIDLSTGRRASTFPEQFREGLSQHPLRSLRLGEYGKSVKNHREDVHGPLKTIAFKVR